jgi:dephospho-CoA kinase
VRNAQVSARSRKFLAVGVTGGLASGKSSLCSMLAARGAQVIDLDEVSREVTRPGSPTLRRLAAAFGKAILTETGGLDRKKLAEVAFAGPQSVRTLNRLTHAPIVRALNEKLEGLSASGYDGIVAVEAALIVEEGRMGGILDVLIVVTCRDSIRRQRLSHLGEAVVDELVRRSRWQLSDAQKAQQADYVIENDGTMEDLKDLSGRLWEWLLDEKDKIARKIERVKGD